MDILKIIAHTTYSEYVLLQNYAKRAERWFIDNEPIVLPFLCVRE